MYEVIEHHIQRDILVTLAAAASVRFSELKPKELESNSFMYHLKELIKIGLVEQRADKRYALTNKGLAYIDGLTFTNKKPRKQPKLICILALKNDKGEYLLAKRLTQPTIGTWMLPSGKQHFGESTEDHAKRELKEQFGADVQLKHQGMVDVRISHGDELVSHLMAQVYYAAFSGGLPADTSRFHYEWLKPPVSESLTPGTSEIIEALESGQKFMLSLDVSAS